MAIKIIKSRRPFLAQALTEIDLLTRILDRDENDEFNVVRLVQKFNYRNHQCLVFEMLSYNLYELLKNTKFFGVSLNLIRKFSKQILRALEFLARPDVDIIHCDLKPENILLKHPRRSAIKLIDFGSSCLTTERKYSYIQSRFYRSPEVLLGLPYDQQIDMWSLGCLLVEMHTGEPLFGGTDQVRPPRTLPSPPHLVPSFFIPSFVHLSTNCHSSSPHLTCPPPPHPQADQMCRIVDVLGMPPLSMLEASPAVTRATFFERVDAASGAAPSPECDPAHRVNVDAEGAVYYLLRRTQREAPRQQSLADIIGAYIGGPFGRRKDHDGHTEDKYVEFLEFIRSMLIFDPAERASAVQALQHPYLMSAAAPRGEEASQGGHSTAVTLGGSVRSGSGAGGAQATERDAADAEAGSKRSGREHSAPSGHQRIRSRSAPTSTKAQSASPNVRGDDMDQEPPPGV